MRWKKGKKIEIILLESSKIELEYLKYFRSNYIFVHSDQLNKEAKSKYTQTTSMLKNAKKDKGKREMRLT